jgi:hypothetical protein
MCYGHALISQEPPEEVPEAPEAREMEEIIEIEEVEEIAEIEEVEEIAEMEEVEEIALDDETSDTYSDTVKVAGRVEVIETPDQTRVTLGKNEVIIVEESGDTIKVALGSKGISIVEGDEGVVVNVIEMEERKSDHKKKTHKKKFEPHWAGFKFGLNNYLTPDFSLVLPPGEEFMDLNTGKSWNWNLDVADIGIGLGTSYAGILSGLGFEFLYYNFDGQNNIMKDPDTREIIEYVPSYAGNISKSKMHMAYLTAPLMLEFQIPVGRERIHINGGVIGGVKLWSSTKIKYREAGEKNKEKRRSDYNLSPLRWGFAGSIGYANFSFFGRYYMTTLFKPDTGPELYPFTVGIALNW